MTAFFVKLTALAALFFTSSNAGDILKDGQFFVDQVTVGSGLEEVKKLFGEPIAVVDRENGFSQNVFEFNSRQLGYVNGFVVFVKKGVVVSKAASYIFNPLVREDGSVFAEFPGGEQWKFSFCKYLEKTVIVGPVGKITNADRSFLINAILIPFSRLTPEQREEKQKEKVSTDCAILKYLQSQVPKESQVAGKEVSVAQVIEMANNLKASSAETPSNAPRQRKDP